jgi:branched-chain amino acid transport system substrate-binding protein
MAAASRPRQNAPYGAQWKKGFDLALEEVNARGGVKGRPLEYVFEDSRADPRQTVAIAQNFVSDPKIVVEVGDLSSTASMAASSINQRAGLGQFGFTNSHPNFTKGGDFIWSEFGQSGRRVPRLAKYAADLGFKRLADLYLNTDWRRASQNIFS